MCRRLLNHMVAPFLLMALLVACTHAPTSDEAGFDKTTTSNGQVFRVRIESFPIINLPVIGETAQGEKIYLGGFSGLFLKGPSLLPNSVDLMTHTDRGPNTDVHRFKGQTETVRPFVLPDYQPRLAVLRLDFKKHVVTVEQQFLLRTRDNPVTGLPNAAGDDLPATLAGQRLAYDPNGVDTESMDQDASGDIWMVEEYRPSILKVSKNGVVLKRFVPKSKVHVAGTPRLPAVYAHRAHNLGFEAVAVDGRKLYAFMQGPLDVPKRKSNFLRILEFDIKTEKPTGEYLYPLQAEGYKVSDATRIGPKKFLVLERDDLTGSKASKNIFEIDLAGATNTLWMKHNSHLETLSDAALKFQNIQMVQKTLYYDLVQLGLGNYVKFEGLALIDPHTLALVYDNDFNVSSGFDEATGKLHASQKNDLRVYLIRRLGL